MKETVWRESIEKLENVISEKEFLVWVEIIIENKAKQDISESLTWWINFNFWNLTLNTLLSIFWKFIRLLY